MTQNTSFARDHTIWGKPRNTDMVALYSMLMTVWRGLLVGLLCAGIPLLVAGLFGYFTYH